MTQVTLDLSGYCSRGAWLDDHSDREKDQTLNGRDYGDLSGLNKNDARKKWGEEQVPLATQLRCSSPQRRGFGSDGQATPLLLKRPNEASSFGGKEGLGGCPRELPSVSHLWIAAGATEGAPQHIPPCRIPTGDGTILLGGNASCCHCNRNRSLFHHRLC